jgi:hypothetical protein
MLNMLAARPVTSNPNILAMLPVELRDDICAHGSTSAQSTQTGVPQTLLDASKNPAIAPANPAKQPILEIPFEVFQYFVAHALPAKDVVIEPLCGHVKRERKTWAKHNSASDLMVVCRKFKKFVIPAVYQQRHFAIHVHQGRMHTNDGGIEFVDAGRQPLQFMAGYGDLRFPRFSAKGADFGFNQLKKIHVAIYAPQDGNCDKNMAVATYFTNQALVRLLQRGDDEENLRVVSLQITFPKLKDVAGEPATAPPNNYWWDSDKDSPRSTSMHGWSDVELALRPFFQLTRVHNVKITLPDKVDSDLRLVKFVDQLKKSMTSHQALPQLPADDLFDHHLEALRKNFEDIMFMREHGRFAAEHEKIGEAEMNESPSDDFGHSKNGRKLSEDDHLGGLSKRLPGERCHQQRYDEEELIRNVDLDEQHIILSQIDDDNRRNRDIFKAAPSSSQPPNAFVQALKMAAGTRAPSTNNNQSQQSEDSHHDGIPAERVHRDQRFSVAEFGNPAVNQFHQTFRVYHFGNTAVNNPNPQLNSSNGENSAMPLQTDSGPTFAPRFATHMPNLPNTSSRNFGGYANSSLPAPIPRHLDPLAEPYDHQASEAVDRSEDDLKSPGNPPE